MRSQFCALLLAAFATAAPQDDEYDWENPESFDLQRHHLDKLLTGTDYEFDVTYSSGLELSTEDDDAKRRVLPHEEVTSPEIPQITLRGLDEEARKKRYISFAMLTILPLPDEELRVPALPCPWLGVNLTVHSNGTLNWGDESSSSTQQLDLETGEVQNGTIAVWEHTPEIDEVLNEIFEDNGTVDGKLPLWFQLGRIYINGSGVSDFNRANIDFKYQNADGYTRCDVSDTGAPIPGADIGDGFQSCNNTSTPTENQDSDDDDNDDDDDAGNGSSGSNDDGDEGDDSSEQGGGDEDAGSMLSTSWSLVSLAVFSAAATLAL